MGVALVAALVGVWAVPARGSFHEWRISEIYSNASGSVQFIEFLQPAEEFDDERFLLGQTLTDSALGHSFSFSRNLPSAPQASSRFLVATPGYTALTGVPLADYVLPANNFFSTAGDTITFASFVDQATFTGAQLPTNGVNSLNRDFGVAAFTSARNSPTNFSGQTGSVVPEPAAALPALLGLAALLRRRRPAC
jgi:MYXO-CTERM domain-containing protein